MKFTEILAAVGLAPKTLDQAKATISAAQPALNSVSALFTAAGLDLDAMLAAGPDSLKAHLDGLSAKDGELAAAQAKVTELTASLATATTQEANAKTALTTATALLATTHATIGFDANAKDAAGKPIEFKTAFKAHVTKEAAAILAKDGRPPLAHETTPPAGKDAPPDTSKLTGTAKTKAVFDAKHKAKYSA